MTAERPQRQPTNDKSEGGEMTATVFNPDEVLMEARALRDAFGTFPSSVSVLATVIDGVPIGMTASTLTPVSLDPPLVSVCVARESTTWPVLSGGETIGVSVLAEHHSTVARSMSVKAADRFVGVAWHQQRSSAAYIDGAVLYLETKIHDVVEAGDHVIVLLALTDVRPGDGVAPIVFHRSKFSRVSEL
jgi:flavin reductase (DIM6/NTAB) family NADH-FMN oxidoreductase RutF